MCFPILIILFMGLGALELTFPNALSLSTLNDNYTGRGWAGLIVLVFELTLAATWSNVAGIVLITIGVLLTGAWIANSMSNRQDPLPKPVGAEDDRRQLLKLTSSVVKSAFTSYVKTRRGKGNTTN
ncbi:hypothetical protein [Halomicronema sp. CCY15110]|uniref:hypothetical protein n=1 Tax=Halomicronema sp. CCY15110 TaxID=2767773 RepID=UPI00194F3EA4|nr:hypothetical protein [Halomicronema sp. CCY15110]